MNTIQTRRQQNQRKSKRCHHHFVNTLLVKSRSRQGTGKAALVSQPARYLPSSKFDTGNVFNTLLTCAARQTTTSKEPDRTLPHTQVSEKDT